MPYHKEEKSTVWVLEEYEDNNPNSILIMTFAEGDTYKCKLITAGDDDNGLELDDPNYDEYFALYYDVVEVVDDGPNAWHENDSVCVTLSYDHFPILVTANDGTVVYQAE